MKKTQIILFYLIIGLALIGAFELFFSKVIVVVIIILMLISIFISLKYNIFYLLSKRVIGNYSIKNLEVIIAIIVVVLGLFSLTTELNVDGQEKQFFNFYYLLIFPLYFLSMVRISKETQ